MQRKIYSQLVDWKQSSDCRFCFHKYCCFLFVYIIKISLCLFLFYQSKIIKNIPKIIFF